MFTGSVDDREFDAWLASATCAVNLRFPTDGEDPVTITRCLAAGLPTIVNDHGPLRELPGDAVIKLSFRPDSDELASALGEVLTSADRRQRLTAAALRQASTNSLDSVAERFWNEVICAR